jgi:hypothetical protein
MAVGIAGPFIKVDLMELRLQAIKPAAKGCIL